MNIDSSIFKSYDIRGVYPDQINDNNLAQIVKAIYTFLSESAHKDPLTIAVGRDMRMSSPLLFQKATEALVSLGATVIDLGILSTPTFYFAVYHYQYDCGIQITASHNPKQYNGIKIVRKGDAGLIKIGKPTGMITIKDYALSGKSLPAKKGGTITQKENTVTDEVTHGLKLLGNPKIHKYKIVADPANAVGALYIEELFRQVPAELIKMNFDLDGTFPVHQADPLQLDTLKDLQKKVIDEKADFGLAPDGDGDRLFFIDEKGQVVQPTLITSLVAKELLKKHPGDKILFDIRYILTPRKIVQEAGGTFEITKVGHAFITEQMNKSGGVFAGESSAHFFYRDAGNAESQVLTILYVLKVLTELNKPLSEVVNALKRSEESGEFNFRVQNAPKIILSLKEKYKQGELYELDGIAVTYPTWRFSVRTSNTEPLLRLNVEANTKEEMLEKREEIINAIKSIAVLDSAQRH